LPKEKLADWFLSGTIGTPVRNGWHQTSGQGGFFNRYIQTGEDDTATARGTVEKRLGRMPEAGLSVIRRMLNDTSKH